MIQKPNFKNKPNFKKISRGSEVVKRAGLKIPSLSGFAGSNPVPCIARVAQLDRAHPS